MWIFLTPLMEVSIKIFLALHLQTSIFLSWTLECADFTLFCISSSIFVKAGHSTEDLPTARTVFFSSVTLRHLSAAFWHDELPHPSLHLLSYPPFCNSPHLSFSHMPFPTTVMPITFSRPERQLTAQTEGASWGWPRAIVHHEHWMLNVRHN